MKFLEPLCNTIYSITIPGGGGGGGVKSCSTV